jgi:hypothetical protein
MEAVGAKLQAQLKGLAHASALLRRQAVVSAIRSAAASERLHGVLLACLTDAHPVSVSVVWWCGEGWGIACVCCADTITPRPCAQRRRWQRSPCASCCSCAATQQQQQQQHPHWRQQTPFTCCCWPSARQVRRALGRGFGCCGTHPHPNTPTRCLPAHTHRHLHTHHPQQGQPRPRCWRVASCRCCRTRRQWRPGRTPPAPHTRWRRRSSAARQQAAWSSRRPSTGSRACVQPPATQRLLPLLLVQPGPPVSAAAAAWRQPGACCSRSSAGRCRRAGQQQPQAAATAALALPAPLPAAAAQMVSAGACAACCCRSCCAWPAVMQRQRSWRCPWCCRPWHTGALTRRLQCACAAGCVVRPRLHGDTYNTPICHANTAVAVVQAAGDAGGV